MMAFDSTVSERPCLTVGSVSFIPNEMRAFVSGVTCQVFYDHWGRPQMSPGTDSCSERRSLLFRGWGWHLRLTSFKRPLGVRKPETSDEKTVNGQGCSTHRCRGGDPEWLLISGGTRAELASWGCKPTSWGSGDCRSNI